MRVADLIKKLQELPGDYSVGTYFVPTPARARFQPIEAGLAVNNTTRRVSFSLGTHIPVTMKEIEETFEL